MKKILRYIAILCILLYVIDPLAAPPGGGEDGWRECSAFFSVSDPDGNPISGVQVKFTAEIYGSEGNGYKTVYGTTDSYGFVFLSTIVYYEGYEVGHHIWGSIIDGRYTVISSSNTYSNVSYDIDPDFDVISDMDQNGINDSWELPLAEKFCPSFKLHSSISINKWLAPEPVEIMTHTLYWRRFTYYSGHYIDEMNLGTTDNWNYSDFASPMGYDQPPGGSIEYLVLPHFEWSSLSGNDPNSWHAAYQLERENNNYPHTIYAHFFKENNQVVIQYWIFYPFNDGYNNHEGDWEHINVLLTDDNPDLAQIDKIDFYFHHKVQTRGPSQCEIEGSTHPKIYVGGSGSTDYPIPNSYAIADGGSYPETGWWDEVGFSYDEWVAGFGLYIPYSSYIDGDPDDGKGIIILPEPNRINYNEKPELSWFKADVAFGHLSVDSPWSWTGFDVGNSGVSGPYHNAGWNKTGPVSGSGGYENYTSFPHN